MDLRALEARSVTLIFKLIRSAVAFASMLPVLDVRCKENTARWKWKLVYVYWTWVVLEGFLSFLSLNLIIQSRWNLKHFKLRFVGGCETGSMRVNWDTTGRILFYNSWTEKCGTLQMYCSEFHQWLIHFNTPIGSTALQSRTLKTFQIVRPFLCSPRLGRTKQHDDIFFFRLLWINKARAIILFIMKKWWFFFKWLKGIFLFGDLSIAWTWWNLLGVMPILLPCASCLFSIFLSSLWVFFKCSSLGIFQVIVPRPFLSCSIFLSSLWAFFKCSGPGLRDPLT